MEITILTLGSRGDVQPFVALGLGLQDAGFQVRVATHSSFENFVRRYGLDFAAVEGNPQSIVQGEEGRAWMETERNPFAFASGFRSLMGPVLHKAMRDGYLACQGSQALIFGGPAYYIGYSIAEKLGIPCMQAYVQPVHPTAAFPSALFPLPFKGGRSLNKLSHYLGGAVFWQLLRPVVNEARQEYLDLPPLSAIGPFPEMERRRIPTLYGFSPTVLPKPSDWAAWQHATGYWFLQDPEWTPPDDLLDFLAAGPAPVYVGFGSMSDRDPESMTGMVLQALKQAGQRGVLSTGWGGLTQADLPEDVFKIQAAPHDWLFPRMASVVHHGGAGTTAAGLAAGRPAVIVPFFGDQAFWGDRISELGAGAKPLARKTLSAERLAAAIQQTVQDKRMRELAEDIGRCIRAEDGRRSAAEIAATYLYH